jgi:hypothetical protein
VLLPADPELDLTDDAEDRIRLRDLDLDLDMVSAEFQGAQAGEIPRGISPADALSRQLTTPSSFEPDSGQL